MLSNYTLVRTFPKVIVHDFVCSFLHKHSDADETKIKGSNDCLGSFKSVSQKSNGPPKKWGKTKESQQQSDPSLKHQCDCRPVQTWDERLRNLINTWFYSSSGQYKIPVQ